LFPKLKINLPAIAHNVKEVVSRAEEKGVEVVGVVKGCSAQPEVASVFLQNGFRWIGDSRILNFRRLIEAGIRANFLLLRIPMLTELADVVSMSAATLISEIETIKHLSNIASFANKVYDVIVMVDVGDLREGVLPEDVEAFVKEARLYEGVRIAGVGTNLNCYGAVLPTVENLSLLVDVGEKVKRIVSGEDFVVSAGGTGTLKLLEDGALPEGVNQLRIGEAVLLGVDTPHQRKVPYLRQDTFSLMAEVVEVKIKPSVPIGEQSVDAFGKLPHFEDRGLRKRAIVAIGRQDVMVDLLYPVDDNIEVLGASSDHTILDVTDVQDDIAVGDIVEFNVGYGAMLLATTSPYVEKEIVKTE